MMCTNCNCVFSWDTGLEARHHSPAALFAALTPGGRSYRQERGVIHNPHFHRLSEEARARVLAEREARGIASTREQRFLAGVPAARACDPEAEIDYECLPLASEQFAGLLRRALPDRFQHEAAAEARRCILHHEEVEVGNLQRRLGSEQLGELGSRALRIARLRGAHLQRCVFSLDRARIAHIGASGRATS